CALSAHRRAHEARRARRDRLAGARRRRPLRPARGAACGEAAHDVRRVSPRASMMEWAQYYDAVGDEPRDTLLAALDRFAAPGTAVDLGCGTGRDTFELLRRGWQVVAIDSAAEAISRLRAAAGDDPRLATQVAVYEDAALPECDLVNASWSLPFCRPELFGVVWERI